MFRSVKRFLIVLLENLFSVAIHDDSFHCNLVTFSQTVDTFIYEMWLRRFTLKYVCTKHKLKKKEKSNENKFDDETYFLFWEHNRSIQIEVFKSCSLDRMLNYVYIYKFGVFSRLLAVIDF